ncbi:MAG: hypothetical protein QW728_00590 [Thermoplasmata archaeon]
MSKKDRMRPKRETTFLSGGIMFKKKKETRRDEDSLLDLVYGAIEKENGENVYQTCPYCSANVKLRALATHVVTVHPSNATKMDQGLHKIKLLQEEMDNIRKKIRYNKDHVLSQSELNVIDEYEDLMKKYKQERLNNEIIHALSRPDISLEKAEWYNFLLYFFNLHRKAMEDTEYIKSIKPPLFYPKIISHIFESFMEEGVSSFVSPDDPRIKEVMLSSMDGMCRTYKEIYTTFYQSASEEEKAKSISAAVLLYFSIHAINRVKDLDSRDILELIAESILKRS